jgi:hypothetical protein
MDTPIDHPHPLSPAALHPENYAFRERHWRAPELNEGDKLIFDEPGRILPSLKNPTELTRGVDCRSHYFRVAEAKYGGYWLYVKHGGGTQRWRLDYDVRTVNALRGLESDDRYRLLWVLAQAHGDSFHAGAELEANRFRAAFVDGRLRKRKLRGQNAVRVWIEPQVVKAKTTPETEG